jgi:hypothetical protein
MYGVTATADRAEAYERQQDVPSTYVRRSVPQRSGRLGLCTDQRCRPPSMRNDGRRRCLRRRALSALVVLIRIRVTPRDGIAASRPREPLRRVQDLASVGVPDRLAPDAQPSHIAGARFADPVARMESVDYRWR